VTDTQTDSMKVMLGESAVENSLKRGVIPVLNGLSGKDALYLLENNGLQVRIQGIGTVKKQSIDAGSKFARGAQITLILG